MIEVITAFIIGAFGSSCNGYVLLVAHTLSLIVNTLHFTCGYAPTRQWGQLIVFYISYAFERSQTQRQCKKLE